MSALLQLGTENLGGLIESYDKANQQAKAIIEMIDRR